MKPGRPASRVRSRFRKPFWVAGFSFRVWLGRYLKDKVPKGVLGLADRPILILKMTLIDAFMGL